MSKQKQDQNKPEPVSGGLHLSAIDSLTDQPKVPHVIDHLRAHWLAIATVVLVVLLGLGVFAEDGWLPRTDPLSGKRTGWFGREVPKNVPSSWNPFAPPDPTPTPQLSKEYIYAGSRLLAVEDANASAIPPEDLAVWRPSTGIWYILGSQQTPPQWGQNGDVPVQGDYDGDGKTDFAVFRPYPSLPGPPLWYIVRSSDNTYYNVVFGNPGDKLVPADFDGDGKTDIAVWRPCAIGETCNWYILQSSNNTMISVPFGSNGDLPVPADFDGDGRADVAVWRNSNATFYSVNSSNAQTASMQWGATDDKPVCGDYDGDGRADYAVFRPGDATWYIRQSSNGQTLPIQWGVGTDTLVPNDYDGDGKCDVAVWRPPAVKGSAIWYIRQSHDNSMRTAQWGMIGDIPVPAFYRR